MRRDYIAFALGIWAFAKLRPDMSWLFEPRSARQYLSPFGWMSDYDPVHTCVRRKCITGPPKPATEVFVATKSRTIDEYLAGLSAENRTALQKVRRAVQAAAPSAEECISYGMPAFRLNGKLIAGFKASANHCSFHPMSGGTVATLRGDLSGYDISPGTIRFSARAGLPAALIRKLVRARIAELME
jgi:uncharacterized protein YdhG (YjbR/CyaY superfamily)